MVSVKDKKKLPVDKFSDSDIYICISPAVKWLVCLMIPRPSNSARIFFFQKNIFVTVTNGWTSNN